MHSISNFASIVLFASLVRCHPTVQNDTPLSRRAQNQVVNGPLFVSEGGGQPAPGQPAAVSSGALPAPTNVVVGNLADGNDGDDGNSGGNGAEVTWKNLTGNGADWPGKGEWLSFKDMFDRNVPQMKSACTWGWKLTDNTDEEIESIRTGILVTAKSSGVDKRFILAVIMQESTGCVRVPTTPNYPAPIHNPGIMQSHRGVASCNNENEIKEPGQCTEEIIHNMIADGAGGTADGDGLAGVLNKAAEKGAQGPPSGQAFYWAARMYNSGDPFFVAGSELYATIQGAGNPRYCTDIANRLLGWVGHE